MRNVWRENEREKKRGRKCKRDRKREIVLGYEREREKEIVLGYERERASNK